MEKSPEIAKLATALVAFQTEMETVVYDADNPFYKSRYATLAALVSSSKDLLVKNGLAVSQIMEDESWHVMPIYIADIELVGNDDRRAESWFESYGYRRIAWQRKQTYLHSIRQIAQTLAQPVRVAIARYFGMR